MQVLLRPLPLIQLLYTLTVLITVPDPDKTSADHLYKASSTDYDGQFQNWVFIPKTRQMFSVHTAPEKFKNVAITSYSVWICEWEKLGQENHVIIEKWSFTNTSVFKMFFVKTKLKAVIFKFLRFEERFRKASFWWRFNLDGKSNCRNKATFSNFSEEVRKGRNKYRGIEHISTDMRRILKSMIYT